MLRFLITAGLFAALEPLAQAGNNLPSRLCFTAQGTSFVASVPTTTVQSTASFAWSPPDYATSAASVVTSAATFTSDEVEVLRILPRAVSTGSATVTSTKYITITTQRTISATSILYTTVTSQHSAVLATPAGFTPLALNANITAAGGATRKRSSIDQRRAVQNRRAKASSDQLLLNPNAKMSKAKYPQSVTCVEYVPEIVMVERAEPGANIVARVAGKSLLVGTGSWTVYAHCPPAPATTASTSKSTSASKPSSSSKAVSFTKSTTATSKTTSVSSTGSFSSQSHATTTITITKTSTDEQDTTTTLLQTSTTTTYLPALTSLSICQPNNFVHTVAGLGIGFIDNPYETQTFYGSGISAPDCCAACQLSGTCAGALSWFDEDFCILFNAPTGVCDAEGFYWGFFTDDSGDRPGASVGNGNCGQAIYEGSGDWCDNVFSGPCSTDG